MVTAVTKMMVRRRGSIEEMSTMMGVVIDCLASVVVMVARKESD